MLAVPRHCCSDVAGCSNGPAHHTTFYIMMCHVGQDIETDGNYMYGVHVRHAINTALGNRLTSLAAGQECE